MKLVFDVLRIAVDETFAETKHAVTGNSIAHDRLGYPHEILANDTIELYSALMAAYGYEISIEDRVDTALAIKGLFKVGRRLGIDAALNVLEEIQKTFKKIVAVDFESKTPLTSTDNLSADGVACAILARHKRVPISEHKDKISTPRVNISDVTVMNTSISPKTLLDIINAACSVSTQIRTSETLAAKAKELKESKVTGKLSSTEMQSKPVSSTPIFDMVVNSRQTVVIDLTPKDKPESRKTSDIYVSQNTIHM